MVDVDGDVNEPWPPDARALRRSKRQAASVVRHEAVLHQIRAERSVPVAGHRVFVDSDRASWNIDPDLAAEEIAARVRAISSAGSVTVSSRMPL